ncbi:MAG: hypothetical protein MOB07_18310, partial [Acidobacteria bacterium]|nr:hypothetical protein [Acidobacteriota bacterium]
MRTIRRESLKLNRAKFDALEHIARAFASDKQVHLDFYQHDLNFSEAQSYRLRRNELKGANHLNASEKVIAADAGLTEVFVDDEGNHYGKELGETLKKASGRLNEKGKKRNKLQALAKKYDRQGKPVKARNLRRRNLGHKKSQELKRRAKITITNQINRAINELIKRREPKVIVTEKLDFRGTGPSKEISRRVSYWHRSTLKDRFEFKASAARLLSGAGQSGIHLANLSGMRLLGKGEPQGGRVSMSEVR